MFKRKLYLQIYATIIAALVAVVVVSSLMWWTFGRDALERNVFEMTGKLAFQSLPSRNTPLAEQQDRIRKLGEELGIDISLFDRNRNLVASYGLRPPREPRRFRGRGWKRMRGTPFWTLRLPDRRWLAVNLRHEEERHPFLTAIALLSAIAGAVLLVAYPLVRRLTRRLETLNEAVQRMGEGDLAARAKINGTDEVATLADNFNDTASRIERLMVSQKMLLANASHELRTPLARIRMGVEFLKSKPNKKRQAELEQDIAELDGLIDEILLMSRLDAGTDIAATEEIDLLALLAEEAARYEGIEVDGVSAPIQGDAKLLRRLVRNLLDNAVKHGAAPVHASIQSKNGQLTLVVRDSGAGFAQEDLPNLFEAFYRSSRKQNVAGYGLGLALVRQIAEAHGGTVEAGNQPSGGGEVKVTFPAAGK